MNIMASEKKIKILICGVLPPPSFGHSKMYEMLMASTFPQRYVVNFLNMHFWSYETNKKINAVKIAKMVKYYLQYLWRIVSFRPRYILYNISFYRMPFLKDFLFCMTAIVLGRKIVFHDFGQYVGELHSGLPRWQKMMLRWMLRHAAASIVMGERVKPVYEGLMAPQKLFVVPGTVEDTKDVAVTIDTRRGVNVLFFSHMSTPKGIFVAFEAVPLVLKANPEVRFSFAGPLEGDKVAKQLKTLEHQFPGRITYHGYVEGVLDRVRLFREADIFIFPTLRDVFGLVLLHAMAEGLPIIASYEGTIPEIVTDGENGYLIPKSDVAALVTKILFLAAQEDIRRRMGEKGRERFESLYAPRHFDRRMEEAFQYSETLA